MPKIFTHRKIISVLIAGLLTSATVSAQEGTPLYKQAKAPVEERVRDLLGRMTLEEKIAQLQGQSTLPLPGEMGLNNAMKAVRRDQTIDDEVAKRYLGNGIGTFSTLDAHLGKGYPNGTAARLNLLQDWVMKNTRLGIPIMFHGEALHGAVTEGGTSFPIPTGLGSTWNPSLLREMFGVAAKESRAVGNTLVLAPVLDLIRDPRYGRVEEMYSEDPYLVSELGVAAIQGLQGTGPLIDQNHVIATAKHFVHGQPENGTNGGPSDFSERTMREAFLYPFEKAVKVAKLGAVMPSYNENTGGIPSSANDWLLRDILRKEWGSNAVTVSDYFAVNQLKSGHRLVADDDQAGILAFNSGLDMELPNPLGFWKLPEAVRAGRVDEKDVEAAATRVLTAKFKAGLFEHPYVDDQRLKREVGTKAHGELARKVADQAIVLLKNEGKVLPLDAGKIKTLAVIGPNADQKRLGGYSGVPPYFVTVLDGIRQRLGNKTAVNHAEGCLISDNTDTAGWGFAGSAYKAPPQEKDEALIAQAVETARNADVVVLVLGSNEIISREAAGAALGGPPAYGDSDDLELPGRQNQLVREILKLGKPTVAVLLNGKPYSIGELSASVPGILEGWYLGQETGNAIAGVLFGDVNPSGRLPVTIARNAGQLPVFYYKTPNARLGYVFNSNTPLYPFGFGLSYTEFTYDKPTIDRTTIARDGTAKASVKVTNSGKRAGDEVVQMYIHHQVSSVVQPVIRLRGFQRVSLKPGQSKTVTFDVGAEQLSIIDRKMQRVVEPGKVDVLIGANAAQTAGVSLEVSP